MRVCLQIGWSLYYSPVVIQKAEDINNSCHHHKIFKVTRERLFVATLHVWLTQIQPFILVVLVWCRTNILNYFLGPIANKNIFELTIIALGLPNRFCFILICYICIYSSNWQFIFDKDSLVKII